MPDELKPVEWMGSSYDDLIEFPRHVRQEMGFALHEAQRGTRTPSTKILAGFSGASVLEVVEDFRGDTYRAVYTVRFAEAVYVLHCFQKKSHRGSETPRPDMNLIRSRLALAQIKHEEHEEDDR